MEDQDQKLEKAERLMEEKIKYYEDEEYKLRIRTTLTEIELKEMKEM